MAREESATIFVDFAGLRRSRIWNKINPLHSTCFGLIET